MKVRRTHGGPQLLSLKTIIQLGDIAPLEAVLPGDVIKIDKLVRFMSLDEGRRRRVVAKQPQQHTLKADSRRLLDAEALRLLRRRLGAVDGNGFHTELRRRALLKGLCRFDRHTRKHDKRHGNEQSGQQPGAKAPEQQ